MNSRTTIIGILLFVVCLSKAQNPSINTDLPTIIPPSPSVAALMKFEEVPVNNYTGTPDISIPLYGVSSTSEAVALNLALKYHPSSIAVDEVASYVGLGWSLNAGGVISRTVKGLPDEHLQLGGGSAGLGKVGIYHTSVTNHENKIYDMMNSTQNGTAMDSEVYNKYLWETHIKGKFDTEHDLYQFNFMGFSGRFIIKKNITTGQLEVVHLNNDHPLKIVQEYNASNYVTNRFIIYDDKGFKYVFDAIEVTTQNSTTDVQTFYNSASANTTENMIFNSAFHLSKIYDQNNNLLIEYFFNTEIESRPERKNNKTITINHITSQNPSDLVNFIVNFSGVGDLGKLIPYSTLNISTQNIQTKKVKEIQVKNKAKIHFILEEGRLDGNTNAESYKLKEIQVKDWYGTMVKHFELFYDYSEVIEKRMILKEVREKALTGSKVLSHKMDYKTVSRNLNLIGKDYWGYFNLIPINHNGAQYRETTPSFCTSDVLQKMILPTGGALVFDFESNTYSHIGDEPVTDFTTNPDNTTTHVLNFPTLTTSSTQCSTLNFSSLTAIQYFDITTSFNGLNASLVLKKNGTQIASITCGGSLPCKYTFPYEAGALYEICLNSIYIGQTHTAALSLTATTLNPVQKQFLYGGGIRIKRIGFFENETVNSRFYENSAFQIGHTPVKEVEYSYAFFNQNQSSSGALCFAKPVFQSNLLSKIHLEANSGPNGFVIAQQVIEINYDSYTDYNNLAVLRTHGSDVGYQNVTVYETSKGKREYVYTSPIDSPEPPDSYSIIYPFFPSPNYDFKRGLLLMEKYYDDTNRLLTQTISTYDKDDTPVNKTIYTGIRTYSAVPCAIEYKFPNYEARYNDSVTCATQLSSLSYCQYMCNAVSTYIHYYPIFEAYGWPKLLSKKVINYFYQGNTSQDVETIEQFTYNTTNKKLASYSATNSANETLLSNYYYHSGNSIHTQNRISEIEKIEGFVNGVLTERKQMNYATNFTNTVAVLPQTIAVSKENRPLETRVRFLRYSPFGQPLELQQENGTTVCYIWGYSQSVPVAKIENIAYSSIPSPLITAIHAATTETQMETALNALRASTALADAMVTTMTYKPLVGIQTMVDPKGYKTFYHYDEFNRLERVIDMDGSILSENSYHYRTQN